MYQKLEDGKQTEKSVEEQPASECSCPCAEPAVDSKEPAPTAKYATVQLGVYYDING